MQFKRTRIAPTPSGYLHLGNALSFALTAYLAKRSGARVFLRIDDMDRDRMHQEYVQDIFDTLLFLGIAWQEGPSDLQEFETKFSQLHRLHLYNEALEKLKEQGALFACTCSRSQLAAGGVDGAYPGTCRKKNIPLDEEGVAWRLYTDDRLLTIRTMGEKQVTQSLPSGMRDFIVRKKDGFPAYQLTSMIDDICWDMDLAVRGEDLWESTLAQQYLASVMKLEEFDKIRFFHHPLLTGSDGLKFSKSAGATSIRFLRAQGKSPAEIYTMIAAMLGFEKTVQDFYSLGRMIVEG